MVNVIECIAFNYDDFVNAVIYCGGVTTGNFGLGISKKSGGKHALMCDIVQHNNKTSYMSAK